MTRLMIISTALAALGLGAFFTAPNAGWPVSAAFAQETDAEQTPAEELDTSTIAEMRLGDPDAPVTVIEYASFTCPHCATFHNGPYDKLKEDFIDTGKVNFIYREVYFDRFGLWASMIARCAGTPETFFRISEIFYERQEAWARAGDPQAVIGEMRRIGLLAGLESDQMETCLQDSDYARTLVKWYEENATEHGIRSTPSFVINGTTYNNMPYDEMVELIDEASAG